MPSNPTYSLNPATGTTAPIYVPASDSPKTVKVGECYFWLQVKAAQAYFADDSFFYQYLGFGLDKIKNIIVTSKIRLDVPALDDAALGIKLTRDLKRGVPEQLGLSPNLINLVPATMTQAEVSLDFVVDRENQLARLAGMINTDSLFTPLSLAPATLAVAKTVGSLAQKTIQAFIPASEQKPILQFSGAFNFAGGGSLEGYYVILGTRDTSAPLPPPTARLEVQGTSLLVDGRPADRLSYVILELRAAEARTRAAGAKSPWDVKLREAEHEAQLVGKDPRASDEARKQAWNKVVELLRQAHVLLSADANYLPAEADKIYWASYELCEQALFARRWGRRRTRVQDASYELCKQALFAPARDKSGAPSQTAGWQPDEAQSRAALGIPADLDLDAALDEYLDQVNWTRANVPPDVL